MARMLTMSAINGFAPIEGESARVLILGSMPGAASLAAGRYYAHPQNTFWKIMEAILGIAATADYQTRIEVMKSANIVLWDVLESCIRPGSMDTAIDMRSAKTNDIASLLKRQPQIHTICFNGGTAEKIFKKCVMPSLEGISMKYVRLPSTSPTHASMPFNHKARLWRAAIQDSVHTC